jgi:transcriptional regulator GlxA family with amidase domain
MSTASHGLQRSVPQRHYDHRDRDRSRTKQNSASERETTHSARWCHNGLRQTPGRFDRQARVTAAQLLTTTDLPVRRVATRCGFASQALRQAFTREYGIAPSQYRTVAATSA